MDPFVYVPADDPLFGAVDCALDHDAGTLVVSGGGLPRAEVRRAAGTTPESHVPIGTRDPGSLTLRIDGIDETLRPSKGFLTRRSYRVEVVSGAQGCRYLLVPDSLGTSRLSRDGGLLGVFTSTGDGSVTAEWQAEGGSGRGVGPYDASVGYALAAAFGTGAEPMWKLTLNAVLDLWP
ncbi:hypothetical protein J7E93_07855 [Streptomyces sp. ISL-36]|uniref:hypothetical protein n=1 Tax=Streptomyces sp. ISL-36 TaxID=2819182 RepID=UPI001BEB56C9|nr:hypothetical protein [Streptomyces sp. ISL-36]MBT2440036.1 hypothetical protein [Streptomyces sp. ISL-36]